MYASVTKRFALLTLLLLAAILTACGSSGAAVDTTASAPAEASSAAEPSAAASQAASEPAASAAASEAASTAAAPAASGAASGAAEPAASNAAQGEVTPTAETKYDPPITMTTMRPYTATLPPEYVADDNPITDRLRDELGIDLTYVWSLDGDEAEQRLNLAISSGDLPDITHVPAIQFEQLIQAGAIEDLTAAYEEFASPLLKEVMQSDEGRALQQGTRDGKLYGLAPPISYVDSPQLLFVRADWLEKLNLPEPTSMADVLAISEAFTNQDPDGNGAPDTYGLGLEKQLWAGPTSLQGFFNGYHAYPNAWVKDASGQLVFGSTTSETRAALEQLQQLYLGNQIDPEFGNKDQAKVGESYANNKLGMFFGPMWSPIYPLQAHKDLVPEAEWTPYALVSADDQPARPGLTAAVGLYTVVKKGVANPEAIVKIMNRFVEVAVAGSKTDYLTYLTEPDGTELNNLWPNQPFRATKNLDIQRAIAKAIESGDTSAFSGEQGTIYDRVQRYLGGDNKDWQWNRIFGAAPSTFAIIGEYSDNDILEYNYFTGAPTPTAVQRGQTLETLQDEVFTRIIQGSPIEEFDQFVLDWQQGGGTDITKEVNDWYAKQGQ